MNYRYENTKTERSSTQGATYYVNTVYLDIPFSEEDQYVITTIGDRLDLLAQDIYGDVSFWWILAVANSLPGDSLTPPIGSQLRIPANVQSIITNYKSVNAVR